MSHDVVQLTQPRQLFQAAMLPEVAMAYFLKGVTFSGLEFRHDDWGRCPNSANYFFAHLWDDDA